MLAALAGLISDIRKDLAKINSGWPSFFSFSLFFPFFEAAYKGTYVVSLLFCALSYYMRNKEKLKINPKSVIPTSF